MTKILTIPAVLCLSLLVTTPSARADWGFQVGIDFGGGRISGGYHRERRHVHRRPVVLPPIYAPPVHVHVRVPVYATVWVPPVYGQAIVGYNAWGQPIYRTVMIQAGYHRKVITGYRCSGCRAICD